jgi:hypothetical protein
MGKHTKLPGIESASSMRVPATRDVMERLAEYEDTGLTPEEIGIIKKQLLDEPGPLVATVVAAVPHLVAAVADTVPHLVAAVADTVPHLVAAVVENLPALVEQKIMELSQENLREN